MKPWEIGYVMGVLEMLSAGKEHLSISKALEMLKEKIEESSKCQHASNCKCEY